MASCVYITNFSEYYNFWICALAEVPTDWCYVVAEKLDKENGALGLTILVGAQLTDEWRISATISLWKAISSVARNMDACNINCRACMCNRDVKYYLKNFDIDNVDTWDESGEILAQLKGNCNGLPDGEIWCEGGSKIVFRRGAVIYPCDKSINLIWNK